MYTYIYTYIHSTSGHLNFPAQVPCLWQFSTFTITCRHQPQLPPAARHLHQPNRSEIFIYMQILIYIVIAVVYTYVCMCVSVCMRVASVRRQENVQCGQSHASLVNIGEQRCFRVANRCCCCCCHRRQHDCKAVCMSALCLLSFDFVAILVAAVTWQR